MFTVERHNARSGVWTTLLVAAHPIGPSDLRGPDEMYPPSETPGNATAFTGLPGTRVRVRFDDHVIEEFEWDKVPVNPFDPANSDYEWGWKSVMRNRIEIPVDRLASPLSFMG